MPEDGAGEEAGGEWFEEAGVEGVRVGYGEEEGVDAAEGGDVVLRDGDDARLAGEGRGRREDGQAGGGQAGGDGR